MLHKWIGMAEYEGAQTQHRCFFGIILGQSCKLQFFREVYVPWFLDIRIQKWVLIVSQVIHCYLILKLTSVVKKKNAIDFFQISNHYDK